MKRTLILAVMAVVTPTCGALAQSVVEIPSRSDTWMQDPRDERPPRERPSRQPGARTDDDDEAGRTFRTEERSSPPGPGRGARFHIEDGQSRIDLRCPDSEPMKTCADVLLQVLDRMQAKPTQDEKSWRDDRGYRPRSE